VTGSAATRRSARRHREILWFLLGNAYLGRVGSTDARSVTFFENLYVIVVGLGLALSAQQVVDLTKSGVPIVLKHLPLFFAYLIVAFALAHSSVRYLQLAYEDSLVGPLSKGRVLGDLVLGVGQFLLLIAMALLITRPFAFLIGAILLLVGRPIRDVLFRLAGRAVLDFDRKVALIHVVSICTFLVTLLIAGIVSTGPAQWVLRAGGVSASLMFGLSLYLYAFDFFFPRRAGVD